MFYLSPGSPGRRLGARPLTAGRLVNRPALPSGLSYNRAAIQALVRGMPRTQKGVGRKSDLVLKEHRDAPCWDSGLFEKRLFLCLSAFLCQLTWNRPAPPGLAQKKTQSVKKVTELTSP